MAQVAHDEAVLPPALARTGAAQVRRRRRAVVHGAQPEAREISIITVIIGHLLYNVQSSAISMFSTAENMLCPLSSHPVDIACTEDYTMGKYVNDLAVF